LSASESRHEFLSRNIPDGQSIWINLDVLARWENVRKG
jgi:hypothetical protein